jgi:citrate synthase
MSDRSFAADPPSPPGLEGVVVADTELSRVDGAGGRLVIRGFDVEDLAEALRFEEICGLLWTGELPDANATERLRAGLARGRALAFERLPRLGLALALDDPMDALRAALAQLLDGPVAEPELRLLLTGAAPVFAASWARGRVRREPLAPDPALEHAEDALRMLFGERPTPARKAAFEAYLVTVAEHGMNASTFAARVVASTRADSLSAVVAALGALKGPLHGGAPGPVLDMLDAIGSPERATGWLEGELAAGRRIMGMGHRVYRVRDPRAAVLERALESLEREGIRSTRLSLARAVESAARDLLAHRAHTRALEANVEFYTAVLLDAIGIPRALFTACFAMARTAGWLAHVEEERRRGRLIRPDARYVGPEPAQRRERALAGAA